MRIDHKLKSVREMNQLSGNKMAEILNVSAPTYNALEKGVQLERAVPNYSNLANLLGISVDILTNDELDLPSSLKPLPKTIPSQPARALTAVPTGTDSAQQEAWRKWLQRMATMLGSQSELASIAEVDVSRLSRLLSGQKLITQKLMFKVGAAVNNYDWYTPPMNNHEGERLRDWLDYKQIDHQDFAEKIGNAKSAVSALLNRESIHPKKWLEITSALDEDKETILQGVPIIRPKNRLNSIDTTIPNVPARLVRHVGNFSGEPIAVLPFVPVRARAGLATPQYWEQPFETMRIMRATLADYEPDPTKPRRSWWVIEIDGDSMEPQLRSRARVLGYYVGRTNDEGRFEIDRDQLRSIRPGIWAIQYDDEFVIKRIRANNIEQDGGLTAHSDNPPPDPFFIRADSIRHVWFIETVVNSPVR